MQDILLYLLGVFVVLAGLAVSIGLHELGHLIPAKLFGVKVTQYMIGFGRTLWSRKKGETEYGIKLIPLGGYVAMTGMYPPQKAGQQPRASTTGFLNTVLQEGQPDTPKTSGAAEATDVVEAAETAAATSVLEPRPGGMAGLVRGARDASAATVRAGEEHRTFYQLPMVKKIVIMLGGPAMNLVLAALFYAILVSGFGVPQSTTTLASVSECLVPANSQVTECGAESVPAPAADAGLQPGDTITAIDGDSIESWGQVQTLIAASPNVPLRVVIDRDGSPEALTLTPVPNERVVVDDRAVAVRDSTGDTVTETVGMVGIVPASELVKQPLTEVPRYVGDNVAAVTNIIVHLPQRMVDVWNAAFGSAERDLDGPISVVGVGRIAGEIASHDTTPVASKVQTMVGLLASLNVALFVFNLIPLLPLDGGHVLGALYEGAKRRFAQLIGRPDPGPVDTARMVPITLVVVVLLGAMSLLLIYADLVKPVSFFG